MYVKLNKKLKILNDEPLHFGGCCVCVWAQSAYTKLNNNYSVKARFHDVSLYINAAMDEDSYTYPVIYFQPTVVG